MPLLRFVAGLSPAYAVGTCVVAVFFTTLGGSYRHHRLGHLSLRPILPIIISGAIASAVFSLAFVRLARHGEWLDMGMGVVFSLISARMILEGIAGLRGKPVGRTFGTDIEGTLPQKVAIGGAAGMLPGLLGIGTGSILVPAFTFLLRAPVRVAVAASLACFCFNSLISSVFKLAQGFIDANVVLPVCLGTLIGANVGAVANKRLAPAHIKLVFGLVFSYVSVKFILSSFTGSL